MTRRVSYGDMLAELEAAVRAHPGHLTREIAATVRKRRAIVQGALQQLRRNGRLVSRMVRDAHKHSLAWFPAPVGTPPPKTWSPRETGRYNKGRDTSPYGVTLRACEAAWGPCATWPPHRHAEHTQAMRDYHKATSEHPAMIVGDLFSGIGGFSLAAHWMGWRTAFFSEIDPYACRVLAHHWPDVPNLGDITKIDWSTVPPVDVLTGGFPCQPHSLAGKRAASADSRDLWSECVRALRSLRPRYAVFENVPGLFTSDGGRFFNRVLHDVAASGYDAEWRVLSAADVGAPHRRERVWITLANADGGRREQHHSGERTATIAGARHAPMGDAVDSGLEGHAGDGDDWHESGRIGARPGRPVTAAMLPVGWDDAVPVRGYDGTVRRIPSEAAEQGPESPLWPVADGVPGRVARLRAIGNSIVPACALEIFRSLPVD